MESWNMFIGIKTLRLATRAAADMLGGQSQVRSQDVRVRGSFGNVTESARLFRAPLRVHA